MMEVLAEEPDEPDESDGQPALLAVGVSHSSTPGPAAATLTGSAARRSLKRRGTLQPDDDRRFNFRPAIPPEKRRATLADASLVAPGGGSALAALNGLGVAQSRGGELAVIQKEFVDVVGDSDSMSRSQFIALVTRRYWPGGSDPGLVTACFDAFDSAGTASMTLDDFTMFHAAIVQYDHDRDRNTVELQELRFRAVINYFDASGDGTLYQDEIKQLLRELCGGDGHVCYLLRELGIELGAGWTVKSMVTVVKRGVLRQHSLFTRDLLSFNTGNLQGTPAPAGPAPLSVPWTCDPPPGIDPWQLVGHTADALEARALFIAYVATTPFAGSGESAHLQRDDFIALVRAAFPGGGGLSRGRLAAACYKAFDVSGAGIGLPEFVLFFVSIPRYKHDRDNCTEVVQRLRISAIFYMYDRNDDGELDNAETKELVHALATTDSHVQAIMEELELGVFVASASESRAADSPSPGGRPGRAARAFGADSLLEAVKAGKFARLHLSTHDLRVLTVPRKWDVSGAVPELVEHYQSAATIELPDLPFTPMYLTQDPPIFFSNYPSTSRSDSLVDGWPDISTDTLPLLSPSPGVIANAAAASSVLDFVGDDLTAKLHAEIPVDISIDLPVTPDVIDVPIPLRTDTSNLCLLVTSEISKVADPGDWSTNLKYRDMMNCIEQVLRQMVSTHGSATAMSVWVHQIPPQFWVNWAGSPKVLPLPRPSGLGSAPYFFQGTTREVTDEELMRGYVHTRDYIRKMKARTAQAARRGQLIELETSAGFTANTERAARIATAALIDATVAVAERRFRCGFVLMRPPTHHAVGNAGCCRGESPANLPFGFCHINGISSAIAALWAQQPTRNQKARVAIIDVDVHHGNANEDTWYANPTVLHVNFNERGIWPGLEHGDPTAVGSNEGVGANLNFPIPTGEGDAAYCYALLRHALPAVEKFKPEFIFVACGLDAMAGDPYARMDVSPEWFGWLAAELRERKIAPLLFNLEGGYSPEKCAIATSRVIEGLTTTPSLQFLAAMGLLSGLDASADQLSPPSPVMTHTAGDPDTSSAAGPVAQPAGPETWPKARAKETPMSHRPRASARQSTDYSLDLGMASGSVYSMAEPGTALAAGEAAAQSATDALILENGEGDDGKPQLIFSASPASSPETITVLDRAASSQTDGTLDSADGPPYRHRGNLLVAPSALVCAEIDEVRATQIKSIAECTGVRRGGRSLVQSPSESRPRSATLR